MKLLKKIILLLIVVFIIAQFFSPDKNIGELSSIDAFIAETQPPAEVALLLKESCYDCHSDVTRYPWYNTITPINYWMANHVNDGKKHFNVSNWEANSTKRKDHKFDELIEMVENKEMPLDSYTWTHKEAKLTATQRESIIKWAKNVRMGYALTNQPE